MDVEVGDGLERVLAIVDYSSESVGQAYLRGDFAYCDHEMAQKCLISFLLNLLK